MMLRYTLKQPELAAYIDDAVGKVLNQGFRTADISDGGANSVSTREMGDAVVAALRSLAQ